MKADSEIVALLQLIDDPDDEVYDTVAQKLINYGSTIIPELEHLWEITSDEAIQQRIEMLIHRVHFENLQKDFMDWTNSSRPELLKGALLIARYQYPDLQMAPIAAQFEQMRRNVWLELNNYLTPIEQINVFSSILYNFYKLQGHELTERESKYFFINQMLDTHQGNPFTIGIIYLSICEELDIPIFAMNVPRQFIFGYVDTLHHFYSTGKDGVQQIQFYIDPLNGMVYTKDDIELYLRKIQATDRDRYFVPLSTRRIIYKMLEELALCYRYNHDNERGDEIQQLMNIVTPHQ